MDQFLEILKTEPVTTLTVTNGRHELSVEARHLRPEDAKSADFWASIAVILMVMAAIWIAAAARELSFPPVALFLAGIFGRTYIETKIREAGRVTTTIRFTEDAIFVLPAPVWKPVTEWKRFDRRTPHRFVLAPHEGAQDERDLHQHQQRNTPAVRQRRYYSDSAFVVLECFGQRYDIAEVMGPRRANAILARLTLCDEFMDGVVNSRQRLPMRPEDQWPDRPGSVPA